MANRAIYRSMHHKIYSWGVVVGDPWELWVILEVVFPDYGGT